MKNSLDRSSWRTVRRHIIAHLLQLIHDSCWSEHLVLRGSLLLTAWLGTLARNPKDIDWVFRPTIPPDSPLARQFLAELSELISAYPYVEGAMIQVEQISIDDIGDYDYADGRRISLPYQFKGLYAGTIQMDVVFGERLFDEPIHTPIPTVDGSSISIWSVSPELSLAWKLLWLETDNFPQGKDLYDATLLAEQTNLPFDLLYLVLVSHPDWISQINCHNFSWRAGFPWIMSKIPQLTWSYFQQEYPLVKGDPQDWQARLSQALAPTFANLDDSMYPISAYPYW